MCVNKLVYTIHLFCFSKLCQANGFTSRDEKKYEAFFQRKTPLDPARWEVVGGYWEEEENNTWKQF